MKLRVNNTMKALNQLFTFLSGVITLTVFTFGVANAHNEYAMAAAKQPSVEAYTKAHAAEKVARTEAITKADVAIAKANAAIAKVESARAEEKIARAKAYAAWAESNAEAARVKPEERIERLSTVKHYNLP